MFVRGIFKKDDIFPYIGEKRKDFLCDGVNYSVKMNSDRMVLFTLEDSCVTCDVKGEFFKLESSHESDRTPHFNFYGIENGEEFLMTKDHILPKYLGGQDELGNYRTMCACCNGMRGHELDDDEVKILRNEYRQYKKTLSKTSFNFHMAELRLLLIKPHVPEKKELLEPKNEFEEGVFQKNFFFNRRVDVISKYIKDINFNDDMAEFLKSMPIKTVQKTKSVFGRKIKDKWEIDNGLEVYQISEASMNRGYKDVGNGVFEPISPAKEMWKIDRNVAFLRDGKTVKIKSGGYIGFNDKFYGINPDIFERTYDEVLLVPETCNKLDINEVSLKIQ